MSSNPIQYYIYQNDLVNFAKHIDDDPSIINRLVINTYNLLYLALLYDCKEIAELLIEKGADVNYISYSDNYFIFPVFHKVLNNEKLVTLMIKHGANVNIKDHDGNTALHNNFNPVIVKILLDNGADINAVNNSGMTPLHNLIGKLNSYDVIEELLKHGANPNSVASNGRTPLQTAVYNNASRILKLLLEYGADLNILYNKNQIVKRFAIRHNYTGVLAVIDEFEASVEIKEPDESLQ